MVNAYLVKKFYSRAKVVFDEEGAPSGVDFMLGGDEYKQSLKEFNQGLWASSFKDLKPDYSEAIKCMPDLTD